MQWPIDLLLWPRRSEASGQCRSHCGTRRMSGRHLSTSDGGRNSFRISWSRARKGYRIHGSRGPS